MVRVIVKLYRKRPEGKRKLVRVRGSSSYRGFELPRVRVTKGKITVNVWRKSRGNRFWFELARVRVFGSQLYPRADSNWRGNRLFCVVLAVFARLLVTQQRRGNGR